MLHRASLAVGFGLLAAPRELGDRLSLGRASPATEAPQFALRRHQADAALASAAPAPVPIRAELAALESSISTRYIYLVLCL